MQATILSNGNQIGQAHGLVRINHFTVDRIVLDIKSINLNSRDTVPLTVVIDGKGVQVKIVSWSHSDPTENGLVTLRDATLQVTE